MSEERGMISWEDLGLEAREKKYCLLQKDRKGRYTASCREKKSFFSIVRWLRDNEEGKKYEDDDFIIVRINGSFELGDWAHLSHEEVISRCNSECIEVVISREHFPDFFKKMRASKEARKKEGVRTMKNKTGTPTTTTTNKICAECGAEKEEGGTCSLCGNTAFLPAGSHVSTDMVLKRPSPFFF